VTARRTRPASHRIAAALLVLGCIGLIGALLPASAPAATAPYAVRIAQARDVLDEAGADIALPQVAETTAEEIAGLLPRSETVPMRDGSSVLVDNTDLHGLLAELALAGTAAEREAAAGLLGGHLDALALLAEERSGPVAYDAALFERVLADARIVEESALDRWARELQQRVTEWLRSLLSASSGDGAALPIVEYAVWAVSALAVAAVAFFVLRAWRRAVARRESVEVAEREAETPVVAAAAGLPDDVLAYAELAAARGDRREAVRALFGGVARLAGRRGVVERTRTRTTTELVRDVVRAAPVLGDDLSLLAQLFEPAWYGHRDPGESGWDAARAAYVRLEGALGTGGAR